MGLKTTKDKLTRSKTLFSAREQWKKDNVLQTLSTSISQALLNVTSKTGNKVFTGNKAWINWRFSPELWNSPKTTRPLLHVEVFVPVILIFLTVLSLLIDHGGDLVKFCEQFFPLSNSLAIAFLCHLPILTSPCAIGSCALILTGIPLKSVKLGLITWISIAFRLIALAFLTSTYIMFLKMYDLRTVNRTFEPQHLKKIVEYSSKKTFERIAALPINTAPIAPTQIDKPWLKAGTENLLFNLIPAALFTCGFVFLLVSRLGKILFSTYSPEQTHTARLAILVFVLFPWVESQLAFLPRVCTGVFTVLDGPLNITYPGYSLIAGLTNWLIFIVGLTVLKYRSN